ncbi:sodium:dicarboxylate symporter protein [Legionella cherrii]|uniref:Sodium:dicarboxylate symporter protein n=1 Tax=Legionella cherrii TaxID=28084 RepID=A0ABY6T2B9_9GAMM|nr:sodium:dicarboxylate symporter protein [Legionella cherrii]
MKKEKFFIDFLQAGEEIFMRVFSLIMYYAPIGFFAYFAVLVHDLGPQLMANYLRVGVLYYTFGVIYFIMVLHGYLPIWLGKPKV